MNPFARLIALLKPTPMSAEDLEAAGEAAQIKDQIETARASQRSGAGENYQSGRGSQ